MKTTIPYYFLLFLCIAFSCTQKKDPLKKVPEKKPMLVLPFQSLALEDMTDFREVSENWNIAGGVYVDRSKEKTLSFSKGSGVLVNIPDTVKNGNLITAFEHGDIEFECDVMMPVRSNSGLYFQSRYEIQLFDSWGVAVPQHGDMGGIYESWDKTAAEGEEGFGGVAPKVNAAKAPGLWQHLKVIFHAPRFDASGNKVKNARFEEVRLNGAIIHENVEVSAATRGGLEGELATAPLLIQGDHGAVAFRNMRYKLYENRKVKLVNVMMKEYENSSPLFPDLDSLVPIREVPTDSISAAMATGVRPQKLLSYTGSLKIPESGDYIFDYKLNRAGGTFLVGTDTLISMNGNYNLDSLGIAKIALEKGEVPFQLIYNKHVPWQVGFGLFVEGPGVQKHPLHGSSSLKLPNEDVNPDYLIALEKEPITQRGFWMHEGKKKTHCIAVGYPQGIHYSYDLASGSLLQVWNGDFMDATKMWQGRGEKQLGTPAGFVVSLHGDPEFANLNDEESIWPTQAEQLDYKQLAYEFDADGVPSFSYKIKGSTVFSKLIPSPTDRGLKREISVSGSNDIWFKLADGKAIEELPDGSFVVNDESYFIDFDSSTLKPTIRKSEGADELLVKVPSGKQQLNYSIIW